MPKRQPNPLKNLLPFILVALGILHSCKHAPRLGSSLSKDENAYLLQLGVIDEGETVEMFASSSYFEQSGNFYTNRRICAYWIDAEDSAKSSIDHAFFPVIDTMTMFAIPSSLTYASYLKVIRKDSTEFKVYVDADSTQFHAFYQGAKRAWEDNR